MRKRVRKSLTFLMALVMILSVFCGSGMSADARETTGGETIVSEAEDGTAEPEETGASSGENGAVQEVPETENDTLEQDADVSLQMEETTVEEQEIAAYSEVTPADTSTVEKELTHEKYVSAEKEDGTYDLTLTVSGAVGSQSKPQMLDVIYILDVSGSMQRNLNNNTGSSGARRDAAGNAINSMTNSLAANTNLDTRFALVTFSGSTSDRGAEDAWITVNWTGTASDITSASKPAWKNGTNYQAGLLEAKDLLASKREGALTVVVFISDGDVGYYYGPRNGNGVDNVDRTETLGNGDSYSSTAMSRAQAVVRTLNVDYFYTVGVGISTNYSRLNNLVSAADLVSTSNRGHYAGEDIASLNSAFDDIQASVTQMLCSNVTVTDTLSDNVQMVTDANGSPKALEVTVKDKDGKTVVSGDGSVALSNVTIGATYNPNTKQITLDFPDNYELEDGYTYMVTANIEATEAAYEAYRANGNAYPNTGDAGTGTASEGKGGVYTNTEAKVTYTYDGTPGEAAYAKPVIQLHPGTLNIVKTVRGLENDTAAGTYLEKNLKFNVSLNGETKEVGLSAFTYDNVTGEYKYQVVGLSPDTRYLVEEKNADISAVHAYNVTTNSSNVTGTIQKDGTKTAAFTNTYQPSNRTLTIEKQVSGNMGDTSREFNFTLALKKDNSDYTENLTYSKNTGTEATLTATDGSYSFTLKDGDRIVLTIPYGCEYTITEEKLDYKVTINDTPDEDGITIGTLTEDIVITYENEKEVLVPTGVIRTMAPFVIMCAAALGIAAVLLFRRRRPWQ